MLRANSFRNYLVSYKLLSYLQLEYLTGNAKRELIERISQYILYFPTFQQIYNIVQLNKNIDLILKIKVFIIGSNSLLWKYSELEQRLAVIWEIEIDCFNFWIIPISLFTTMSPKLQLANQSSNERSATEQDLSQESLLGKTPYRSRILAENLMLTSFNICQIFIQILFP